MRTDELELEFFDGNKDEFKKAVDSIQNVSKYVERFLDKYGVSIKKRKNFGYANWMFDHYMWSLIAEVTTNIDGKRIGQNSRGINIMYYPNPEKAFEEDEELKKMFFENSKVPRDFYIIEYDDEQGNNKSALVKNRVELMSILGKQLEEIATLQKAS